MYTVQTVKTTEAMLLGFWAIYRALIMNVINEHGCHSLSVPSSRVCF